MFFRFRQKFITPLSIRKRLFLLRIGIGLLMGILIGGLSVWLGAKIAYKGVLRNLDSTAHAVGSQVQVVVNHVGHTLPDMIISRPMEKYYHTGRKSVLISLFQNHIKRFEKIVYINENGIQELSVANGRVDENEKPFGSSRGYQKALDKPNSLVVGSIEHDTDIGKPVIRFYYHQIDYFDNKRGVVQASVSLEAFARYLNTFFQGEIRHFVMIEDTAGKIIYSPENKELGKSGPEIWHHTIPERDGSIASAYLGRQKIHGVPSMVAVHQNSEPDWNIFVVKSSQFIQKSLYAFFFWVLIVTLVVLVSGEIVSRFLGIKIIEPIEKLRQVTTDILEDGNLEKRVEWISDDEMGQLADSFNAMLEKINDAQNALQTQQQFNENILHSITDLMIVVSGTRQIIKVNFNVCKLLGYREDELLGNIFDFFVDDENTILSEIEKESVLGDKVISISQIKVKTKNDQVILLSLSISAFMDHNQDFIGYLITGKDIREELRFKEEKKRAVEKLKTAREELFKTEKLAIIGQMTGLMAHEVLNPVSAIYARLDLNTIEEEETAKIHQLLHTIVMEWKEKMDAGNVDHFLEFSGQKDMELLAKISREILKKDANRVESHEFIFKLVQRVTQIVNTFREMSRTEKNLEQVDLVKLLNQVVEDLGDGLRKRGIQVEENYGEHPEIYADHMELYSIFSNLLKNALQAIEANLDTLEKKISINLWQDKETISIQISDTGIGINSESEKKLFQLGFTNKGREGTGIGLSYSRKVARQFGGDLIMVKSAEGQGTTFQVNLNCQRNEHEITVE